MGDDQASLFYHAYLLRLWRERPASPERPAVWRFSVEDTRTRQRRGFGSLEDLLAFLRALMEAHGEPRGQGGGTSTGHCV